MATETEPSQATGGVGQSPAPKVDGVGQSSAATSGIRTVKIGDLEIPQDKLQEYIDTVTKSRINEVKDKEREKYKDYAEYKALAEEAKKLKQEKLTEDEKKQVRIQELEKDAAEKARMLKERDVRDSKRSVVESLLAEKKISLPEGASISDAIKLIDVNPDETLDTAALMRAFPPSKPKLGVSSGTQTVTAQATPSIDEEYQALLKKGGQANVMRAVQLKNSAFRLKGVIPP